MQLECSLAVFKPKTLFTVKARIKNVSDEKLTDWFTPRHVSAQTWRFFG